MRQRVSATVTRPIKDALRVLMERYDMPESLMVRKLLEEALEARSMMPKQESQK